MRPSESFIEQPIRSLQTMLRVLSEDNKSLPTVIPDGIYGPSTATAISAFQRKEGIPSTGIANQETWDAIVADYELALIRIGKAQPIEVIMDPGKVYRYGEKSPYIYLLQSMLTQLALETPRVNTPGHTGIMDDETVAAVSAFQQLTGLQPTGELDKVTWKHVVHHFSLSAAKFSNELP